jgi:hypothetical protein
MTPLVERLLGEQLPDGGWNCEVENGATVSSFETTINVLEGLLEHERAIGGSPAVAAARRNRGEAYLLERRLFRRKSTGEVIDPSWLEFSFPTWYHYDILRALDYLRDAGVRPDPRVAEAIEVVEGNRDPDGRWPLQNVHEGVSHLEMEAGEGAPSRWNTLRACACSTGTSTTTVPLFARLADIHGRKPVFLVGLALFVIGSVLCGTATSMSTLIALSARSRALEPVPSSRSPSQSPATSSPRASGPECRVCSRASGACRRSSARPSAG